jgi:hypothetical protein
MLVVKCVAMYEYSPGDVGFCFVNAVQGSNQFATQSSKCAII